MKKITHKIKKQKFLIISIIIHIIIFLSFQSSYMDKQREPLKYLEITEINSPDANKLKNKSNRLAQTSNKTKVEKVKKAPIKNFEKKSAKSNESKNQKKSNSEKSSEDQKSGDMGNLRKKQKEVSRDSVKKKKEFFNPGPTDPEGNEEVTVDFNTQEFAYISYFLKLKRKIEMTWSYPKSSIERGETGKVILKITLDKVGKLITVQTIKSSGYAPLDREAKNAMFQAAPFGPFPSSWTLKRINIVITFNYGPRGWNY